VGESQGFHGVWGRCHVKNNAGVFGDNNANDPLAFGVIGVSDHGIGVSGASKAGRGVQGTSDTFQGVYGASRTQAGVVGDSAIFHGVFGATHSGMAGVFGTSDAGGTGVAGQSDRGIGIHGKGGQLAGKFEGDVEVTGDIRLTGAADCAEEFDIVGGEAIEPGTVMVLDDEGALRPSAHAYDRRVAGVISGAGGYRPGIVLDKQASLGNRSPVALLGKVFCRVDARYGPIAVGDLLTTSDTPGHAMRATDPRQAFGAVIGKALRPLREGQGLIPVLIALQ
jgi:hypothetical protein